MDRPCDYDSDSDEENVPTVNAADVPLEQQRGNLAILRRGMKLEALDRKYPDLVCVATIGKN